MERLFQIRAAEQTTRIDDGIDIGLSACNNIIAS